jgi:pectin methylesterase-like acyl-CoA thioesterase
MSEKIFNSSQKTKAEIAGGILLLTIFVFPLLLLAKGDKIYVDDDASGTQNGSSNHPYKTISQALKKAGKHDEVHIRPGVYEENIEIPEGVDVYGSGENEVILKASDDDEPVVKMNHKTTINKVTIKDGKDGIKVGRDDRVSIIKCVIEDNKRNGVNVREGDIEDKRKVSVTESVIKDNGSAGIYSEKRRIILIDNEITENDGDGIILEAGAKAWLEGNSVKDNEKSGMKFTLDGSEIWTKNNTIRDNKREGIEINAFGGSGRIDINKSKMYKNGRYGIARVQRGFFSSSAWNGFIVQDDVKFWDNGFGSLSNIIVITR